jgi:hypothetical protein
MSFVDHGGLGKVFPITHHSSSTVIWTQDQMRKELQTRGVWPSNLSSNVESWYPQVLLHVKACRFTFEEFADEFAVQQPFDFGKTLERLLAPQQTCSGGWLEGVMD